MEVRDEKVIYSNGCYSRVIRWINGWVRMPGGRWGFSCYDKEKETEVIIDVIRPIHTFTVIEDQKLQSQLSIDSS